MLVSPDAASAAVHTGTIQADEAQSTVCFVGSISQGLGTISYDDVTMSFSWSYTYGDNAPIYDDGELFGGATETGSHFHGPAPPGQPASIVVGTGTGNPNIGSALINAQQAADLLADLWFLNIHSTVE